MQIVFLGTSSAKPTKERNHSAVFVSYRSDGILFDCGEGTQRQLTIVGIKPPKINKILISHWHGDHTLGLSGLIQTLGLMGYEKTLRIYGPVGTKKRIKALFDSCDFEERISLEVKEVKEGKFYDGDDYYLEAYELKHSTRTVGFRFIEKEKRRINISAVKKIGIPEGPLLGKLQEGKTINFEGKKIYPKDTTYVVEGKKMGYIPDSVSNRNSFKIAKDVDILICDATYDSSLQEKADKHMHMTAKEAGLIANQSNVKKLIITHFSARYKDAHVLEEDARNVFNNVEAAYDFMKVKL
jgi:ribonuclease Z